MLDPTKELHDLVKADADIRRARKTIVAQVRIVRQLVACRHDPTVAKELLSSMQETLDILDLHRSQIVRNLSDLEGVRRTWMMPPYPGECPPDQHSTAQHSTAQHSTAQHSTQFAQGA